MLPAAVELHSHGHVAVAITVSGYGLTDAQLIKLYKLIFHLALKSAASGFKSEKETVFLKAYLILPSRYCQSI